MTDEKETKQIQIMEKPSLFEIIGQAASDPNFNPESMKVLTEFYESEENKKAKKLFNAAIMNFQSEVPKILKTSKATNSKYAKLDHIIPLIRPFLKDNGFHVRFRTGRNDDNTCVTCILSHVDGHSEESYWEGSIPTNKATNAAQTSGMAITYGERYTLLPMLGLVSEEDTDANPDKISVLVSEDQIEQMTVLLDRAGSSVINLCKYYCIDSIDKLNVDQYTQTKGKLEAVIRTKNND